MKVPNVIGHAGVSSRSQVPMDEDGMAEPREGSVHFGWAVLTSGWTTLVVASLLATLAAVGAPIEPQGASLKELLVAYDFAAARALHGLGISDVAAGWLTLFLYVIGGLNVIGLFLRYGQGVGGPSRRRDGAVGAWVTEVSAGVERPIFEVTKRLPARFNKSRRAKNSDVVTVTKGVWDGAWILVGAAGVTALAGIAVDRASAFQGRVTFVPETRQLPVSEYRTERGDWMKRPGMGLLCLSADPGDPARRRKCSLLTAGGEPSVAELAAGETAKLGRLTVRQLSETAVPALAAEGVGPTILLRTGGPEAPPEKLEFQSNGATYRVGKGDSPTELTGFLGPDGPLVVARSPNHRPVLMVPALGSPPAAVPATQLFVSGVPWWRVEIGLSTDPSRYLRYTALGLLIVALLLMLGIPDLRIRIEPIAGGGRCVIHVRSVNRTRHPAECLEAIVRAVRDSEGAPRE